MQCVGNIKSVRLRGYELMDVPSVPYYALSVRYVEVASHLVHTHVAVDVAPFSFLSVGEGVDVVSDALFRVIENVCVAPSLRVIRISQLDARVTAPAVHFHKFMS